MATPPPQTGKQMNRNAVESFLASKDTGVLSLGVENRGYGFPVSYTYDAGEDHVVLGFVCSPESKKREFASGAEEATFTVYDYDDVDSWRSVIATGSIRAVTADGSRSVPNLFFQQDADDEGATMVDLDEFERSWYELVIEDVSGRHSGQ